ncbi:MAG: formylglycine-generating enzyme family protein, partial [Planctomycetota bacterium]
PLGAPEENLGRSLGVTPLAKPVEVPMGLHRVTLVLKDYGRQSVPVVIGRNRNVVLGQVSMIRNKDVGGPEVAANLVRIPGGKVVLEDGSVEKVEPFYIDRYEYPNRLGTKPLCGVTFEGEEGEWSWSEARQAARDAGKRLPTRAQWMLAAEGPLGLPFPYGKEYDPKAAAVGMAFRDGPVPCGSHPVDRSPFGLYDMSGNVAEWIRDEDDFGYAGLHDACGGRWTSQEPGQSSCRFVKPHTPMDDLDSVGVRCVLEPQSADDPDETTVKTGEPAREIRFEEAWREECPPGMVEIRPRPGTKAFALVSYAFCIDAHEWPNRSGAKPWRGSWHEARALARAAKKRLPTRAEWQVACGGPELLRYPFGNEYADGKVHLGLRADDPEAPYPAGDAEAESTIAPWGKVIYDLCGNVSEWVFDPFDQDHRLRGVVGGCWWNRPGEVGVDRWEGKDPTKKGRGGGVTGFRCVVRLKAPAGDDPAASRRGG